jgi:hypothetical protein
MRLRPFLLAASMTLAALGSALPARADTPDDIRLSYAVTLDQPLPAITNIVTFNSYANGAGAWWAATIPAGTTAARIDDPFMKSSANAPVDALMLGLVQDLPGDAAGQTHVVMMMSDAAAAAARHVAWGTLFRDTDEDQLIAAIELATSGQDWSVIQPGVDAMFAFAQGDARSGILGPGGMPIDAWFALGAAVPGTTTSSNFSVMAFSTGELVGSGTALVATLAPVPEPAQGLLLAIGLTAVGWRLRRHAAEAPARA